MRHLSAGLLLLVTLPVAAQVSESTRFAGTFAIPYLLCDCDMSQTIRQTTRPAVGHLDADTSSQVFRSLPAGAFIEPSETDGDLTVVVRPGEAVLIDTLTIDARRYGPVRVLPADEDAGADVRLSLATGDRVEYLEAEWDFGFIRVGGVVYGTHLQNLEDARVEWLRRDPETEVWLHLLATPDAPAAWVRQYGDSDGDDTPVVPYCASPTGHLADCLAGVE